ncbi:PspC domain-containing protein [Myxococcota bacterium]
MTAPERPQQGRVLGGVCSGLASAFQVDVTLLRLVVLVSSLAWGMGIVLYALAWLAMPTEGIGHPRGVRATATRNLSGLRNEFAASSRRFSAAWRRGDRGRPWPFSLGRRSIAFALLTVGALVLLASLGTLDWVTPGRAAGLAAMALGLSLLMTLD